MSRPGPPDTIGVELEPRLLRLLEALAEHAHDASAKSVPGRVPYAELPASEKERARRTAADVLRALLALGLTIEEPGEKPPAAGGAEPLRGEVLLRTESAGDPAGARRRAEDLLGLGEPLLAYEAIEESLARWPRDLRLRQLRGVALARSGATDRASRTMRRLREEGHGDGETLGILARTHKDLAARAVTGTERVAHLEAAFLAYEQGYAAARRLDNADDACFTGINAATLSLLLGEERRALRLAREVRALGRRELGREPGHAGYWLHATLGEAALLLGERGEAEEQYARAAELAGERYADRSTTRRQARLVLAQRGEDPAWIDEILCVPPVAVFTGHMIDRPDRKTDRFPPQLEGAVARRVREEVRHLDPAAGYASAACGSDILFLEAMQAERREFHVVLPFPPREFVQASVDGFPGSNWSERFDRVLAAAASVTTASDQHALQSPVAFAYANLILTGLAALHAGRLEAELVGLAVWDGNPGGGLGGTESLVRLWQSRDVALRQIDPAALAREEKPDSGPVAKASTASPPGAEPDARVPHQLMAMLFADAVGYSELGEDQIPLFVEHCLGPIAELIAKSPHPPVVKETAGDGLYLVFGSVRDAGLFAVALSERMAEMDWEACGLPATMSLRVALHCGPVHELVDPITGLRKYTGPHTSRTARIEPITPPGQVYASQAFAAIAAATGVDELCFEYVGRTALAKKYGSLALYHVRRG